MIPFVLRRLLAPTATIIFLLSSQAAARPFLTEEVPTIGRLTFEAGLGGSLRVDRFKEPSTTYETVVLPFDMKIGLASHVDLGFQLTYLSQALDTGESRFTGSRSAAFSPQLKYSPWRHGGLLFIWHAAVGDETEQELPIARGDDLELKALLTTGGRIPLTLNVGHVWKHDYHSRQGVQNQAKFDIRPGDISEATLAVEAPLKWGLSLIGEGAYYAVRKRTIDGVQLDGTNGEAADASVGLNWRSTAWDIGAAVSFGLLEERFTSFDLERGSGDVTYRFQAHYRLHPHPPASYD